MNPVISQDYQSFMTNNRIKVNQYLNRILWLFTLAGPAIAVGVDAGIFPDITFRSCCMISLLIAVMSAIHLAAVKKFLNSLFTSVSRLPRWIS